MYRCFYYRRKWIKVKEYIAVDIGGTHIKYGIVNELGKVLSHGISDTEAHLGGQSIIEKVINLGLKFKNDNTQGVAISSAGQINYETGIVVGASDAIPNYIGLNIKHLVADATDLPVEVRNDVDCAALCEQWLGDHRVKDFLTLTIGTGLGGAIVINQTMHSGHAFSAGEWGYMQIEGEQFEKVASITGLINMAKESVADRNWTGEEIFRLYDQEDNEMKQVVEKFYRHLAIGIGNLIYIFNPEKVVIGGGITGRGERFLREVQTEVKRQIPPAFYNSTEIVLAKHSNQSGMLGAVYHFKNRQITTMR